MHVLPFYKNYYFFASLAFAHDDDKNMLNKIPFEKFSQATL